jgi:tRNA threonylcarbamoyladenosine biosynthesis protein TsaE
MKQSTRCCHFSFIQMESGLTGIPIVPVVETYSAAQTLRIGKRIGRTVGAGDVIALAGDLGTGKTHLIKGLAAGLGVEDWPYVSSPSFTLINEYRGRIPLYHLDLYRLEGPNEAEELGLDDYFHGPGVTAVEWADKVISLLPKEVLWIRLSFLGERGRSVSIEAKGARYERVLEQLFTRETGRDAS